MFPIFETTARVGHEENGVEANEGAAMAASSATGQHNVGDSVRLSKTKVQAQLQLSQQTQDVSKIVTAQREVKRWSQRYNLLKLQFEKLEKQHDALRGETTDLRLRDSNHLKSIASLENRVDHLRCSKELVEQKLALASRQLRKIESEVSFVPKGQYLAQKAHDLQKKLKEVRRDRRTLASEHDKAKTELSSARSELALLNTALRNTVGKINPDDPEALGQIICKKAELEQTNRDLEVAINTKDKENNQLTQSIKELWENNQSLRTAHQEEADSTGALQAGIKQREAELEQKCEDITQLQTERDGLIQIVEKLSQQVTQLEEGLAEGRSRMEIELNGTQVFINQQSDELQAQADRNQAEVRSQLEESTRQNQTLQQERALLSEKLESVLDEYTQHKRELAGLMEMQEEFRNAIKRHQEELEASRRREKELVGEIDTLHAELDRFTEVNRDLHSDLLMLRSSGPAVQRSSRLSDAHSQLDRLLINSPDPVPRNHSDLPQPSSSGRISRSSPQFEIEATSSPLHEFKD